MSETLHMCVDFFLPQPANVANGCDAGEIPVYDNATALQAASAALGELVSRVNVNT